MAPTAESRLNVDALSKGDVLLLFSMLEGELEARDLVIQALKAKRRDIFMWERYGKYDLSDPFLALQRDSETLLDSPQGRGDANSTQKCSDPLTLLGVVVSHCRKMQEKMIKQLAAAENRHKRIVADLVEDRRTLAEISANRDDVTFVLQKERERLLQQLEFEKTKVLKIEGDYKRLLAQLEDERVQHQQLMVALERECKNALRANKLSRSMKRQHATDQRLHAELEEEKKLGALMEARSEELLAEFDTEREHLTLRLRKEEARCSDLQQEIEELRTEVRELREKVDQAGSMKSKLEINGHHFSENTEQNKALDDNFGSNQNALLTENSTPNNLSTDTDSSSQVNSSSNLQAAYQAGIQQRFHAALHKFQSNAEHDILPSCPLRSTNEPYTSESPPAETSDSKQTTRITVPQALCSFRTKPPSTPHSPFGTDYRVVAASGAHLPGARSPIISRVERGTPPPIPPKKPGLAETPPSPATLRATHMFNIFANGEHDENSHETDLHLFPSANKHS